jgi:UrcA family protein
MDQSKSVAGAVGDVARVRVCYIQCVRWLTRRPGVRTEDIKFQDLNLETMAGVEALYQRIHSAAQRVCVDSGEPKLVAAPESEKCTKGAAARAIKEINLPALTVFAANR